MKNTIQRVMFVLFILFVGMELNAFMTHGSTAGAQQIFNAQDRQTRALENIARSLQSIERKIGK
jgi:hypothetical protein